MRRPTTGFNMSIEKERHILTKGQTGELDEIYVIQGLLPSGSWDWENGDPRNDRFVMLKNVTLDIKIRVT